MLTVKNFKTLRHGCWLNDEIVNGYISLLNQINTNFKDRALILKSFIYNLLAGQDDTKILRISKK
jgi:Ulp1 family protease